MLSVAGIADIHYLTNHGNKKGLEAPDCLDEALRIAVERNVGLIVDFGDQVSVDHTLTHSEGLNCLARCRDHYNKAASIPRIIIPGNHCQYYEPPGEPYSMDIEGFHVVAFITPIKWVSGGIHIPKDHLDWLEKDLKKATNNKSIVLNHIGFSSFDDPDHKYHPDYFPKFYDNDRDVRDIFAAAGNVIASISGHRHEDKTNLHNGIYHITQQSITQATRDGTRACRASTHYKFEDNQISVMHFGLDRPPDTVLAL